MGEEESVTTERPFQSMNAVERTRAKLRICAASCRGWRPATALSIVAVGEEEEGREGFSVVGGGGGEGCRSERAHKQSSRRVRFGDLRFRVEDPLRPLNLLAWRFY